MIEALIIIGGIIGVVAVGLFVSGRMTKWWSSALYALITASLAILIITSFYSLTTTNPIASLWYARFATVSVIAALTSLYFLTQELATEKKYDGLERAVHYFIALGGIALTIVTFTPLIFTRAYALTTGGTFINATPLILLVIVFMVSVLVLISFQLYRSTRHALHHHGVIDGRFIAVRTGAYLVTLAILGLTFVGLTYLILAVFAPEFFFAIGAAFNPALLVAALVTALAFQPLKKSVTRLADHLFYKDNYTLPEFVALMNQTLNSTNDLRTLLERVSRTLAATFKARQAFFLVYLPDGRYNTAGTEDHSRVVPADFEPYLEEHRHNDTHWVVNQFDRGHPLYRMMTSHRLGLIAPLYKGDALIGFLCLGRSKKRGFSHRDLRALKTVYDEITIAVQNAVSVEEVRKLNDTLEQRVGSATQELRTSNAQLQRLDEAKDEFISMASHQLRTPLTSIKGYVSMLLEGDVGKITKEQRHVLEEAFVSSERMVRLIGDFLNVSRLQTGKFVIDRHPVDLARLIEREIEGLSQNASARGIAFSFKKPKDIPLIELDENKIQQVVMNFADNAIYYSKEKSKVVVSLERVGDTVELTVKDTGIGIPRDEQSGLFTKFFRASNARKARPDGTGVGLFLAKKVIDDHGGEIIFHSEEGKGSTFGFRLPLPKD